VISHKTGLIFCVSFIFYVLSNLVFVIVYSALNLEVTSAYQEMEILLTADHLSNPFNIALFLGMAVIGAPIAEEYVFRRTVIPLLEERGMAPLAAVTASSLAFTLVHAPNDLIFGSLAGTVQHLWAVFFIGFAAGIAYILTRNVLYPVVIHVLFNGLPFTAYLLSLMEDMTLLAIYELCIIIILIVGLGVGVYAIWKYFKAPTTNWAAAIKKKSPINILPGLLGFLVIFSGLITLEVIVPIFLWVLIPNNALFVIIITTVISVLIIVGPLWLATKAEYIDTSQSVGTE